MVLLDNHSLLGSSLFIGKGQLIKPATMYVGPRGFYPILSFTPYSIHNIIVEVYEVSQAIMDVLDTLEGYPVYYTRTKEDVKMENGEIKRGWIYHQDVKHELPIVDSGDWAVREM